MMTAALFFIRIKILYDGAVLVQLPVVSKVVQIHEKQRTVVEAQALYDHE